MIAYTLEMDKSGFWDKIENAVNNNPYTIILKAPDLTGWKIPRPVFDLRLLNSICDLIDCVMPTQRDIDQFFARPGLMSIFDFKNWFDCIPLKNRDRKFAIISTPIGKRIMKHLSYGFKNAEPLAQRIMNNFCAELPRTIGYVDDGTMKHLITMDTDQLINDLKLLLINTIKLNALINISKFFLFCTEVDSVGIR